MKKVKCYAPATVANVVCGYDILGFAIDQPGDEVVVSFNTHHKTVITKIEGDHGKLPLDAEKNVVGHVVNLFLDKINSKQGVDIELYKKMPLNSGLGSSAASSVGALVAVNELFGNPLTREELLPLSMEGERLASGNAHADNVAPSLLGGLVLIRSYDPLDVVKLPCEMDLHVVSVHPHVDVPTGEARKIIRQQVSLKKAVEQWGNIAGLVAGFCTNDVELIGRSMKDVIIEPIRSMLIPYFAEMKQLSLDHQAIGFGISGSGPSVFALCSSHEQALNIANQLYSFLSSQSIECESLVTKINKQGAIILP
ncbi:homoserine kinase [Elizabethkingia sp. JS20170427COW]|uniref:homoserine kinase n=1 Tax=Elizabethkingia sp. JS20170427COW TaxID=2583851 RepID=UPI001110EF66|nr:homoserine kinase [Elizabethkingia sp. JS20170427COW]QCX54277.1 homoserine kinase [Elizabethkingia sp. JS20170427COW]